MASFNLQSKHKLDFLAREAVALWIAMLDIVGCWMALKLLELLLQSFCISLQLQPVRTAKTHSHPIVIPHPIAYPNKKNKTQSSSKLKLHTVLKLSVD